MKNKWGCDDLSFFTDIIINKSIMDFITNLMIYSNNYILGQ